MILLIITIYYSLNLSLNAFNCFAPRFDDPSMCNSCGWDHFHNGSTNPFPSSECLLKQSVSLVLKTLVLSTGSNSTCSQCPYNNFTIQTSLFSTFIYISESCKIYLLCEATIFLEPSGKPHILTSGEKETLELFRRLKVNVTLQPLVCGVLDSNIPCISGSDFFQTILFKAASLKFFFSGSIFIRNIIWDFSDLNYNKVEDRCWVDSKCCSEEKINSYGDICSPKNQEITGYFPPRTYGFFNLELIADDPFAETPSLTLGSCKFVNFYVTGFKTGFTTLFKSVGYSFFTLYIISTSFENVYFPEGVLTTLADFEALNLDPVYQAITLSELGRLISNNFIYTNSTLLHVKNVSFINYNALGVKDLAIYKGLTCNSLLFCLARNVFANFYFDGLMLANISNYAQKYLYLISLTQENKGGHGILYLRNVIATDVLMSGFLYFTSSNQSGISNISLSRWVLRPENPLFLFLNQNMMTLGDLFFSSLLPSQIKSPLYRFLDCTLIQLTNLQINNVVGFTMEIFNTIMFQLIQMIITDSLYNTYLLNFESSIFTVENVSLLRVSANTEALNVIFSFRSPVFNISKIYMNAVSAQSIFDYRGTESALIETVSIENLTGVRTFFLMTTIFFLTQLNDLTIKNSILPRFSEFLNAVIYYDSIPSIIMTRLQFYNLSLPLLNAEIFSGFTRLNTFIRDSVFENVKRIDMSTVPPIGFFFISRGFMADFKNCSFRYMGYTFPPRVLVGTFNYPFIFMTFLLKYSVRYCVFEMDETVSINAGFIFAGFVDQSAEVTNCKFFTRRRNPAFIYRGLSIFHSAFVNFVNNSFSNLSCTPYHLYSHQLRKGPITIQGEDSLSFIKNSKTLELHNVSFENCDCYYGDGGAFHISNYHKVNVSNIAFQNSSAVFAGTWEILSSSSISAINVTVLLSNAPEAGSLHLSNLLHMNLSNYREFFVHGVITGSWKIYNSNITCSLLIVVNASTENSGGFGTLLTSSLRVSQAIFRITFAKEFGGAFLVTQYSTIMLNEIDVEITEAQYGGFMLADDANVVSILNLTCENSSSFLNGGFLYFDLVFRSFIQNIVVKGSVTLNKGIVYIKTSDDQSFHNFINLTCEQNSAPIGSCIYFRSSSGLYIDNITIIKCRGSVLAIRYDLPNSVTLSKLIALELYNVEFLLEIEGLRAVIEGVKVHNCSFSKYVIYLKSSNVSISLLDLYNVSLSNSDYLYSLVIINSIFFSENLKFINIEKKLVCLLNAQSSFIKLKDSYIEGGSGLSAVLLVEKTAFNSETAIFVRNFVTCISAIMGDTFLKNIQFIENKALVDGSPSDISIANKFFHYGTVHLENVNSSLESPGTISNFKNFKTLSQVNCSFEASYDADSPKTFYQGLVIIDVIEAFIGNNHFHGFYSFQGSAIRMSALQQLYSVIFIRDSIFSMCTSLGGGGGALSVYNLAELSIENTFFYGNTALDLLDGNLYSGIGGCAILYCLPYQSRKCFINLENNTFIHNFASFFGPLFISNTIIQNNTVLMNTNNSDLHFFSNQSGNFPPKAMISLPDHNPLDELSVDMNSSRKQSLYNLTALKPRINVKSGEAFSLEIVLTDAVGQILVFDNKSTCGIENPFFVVQPTVIHNGFVKASQGRFSFNGLTLYNIPNTTVKLSVSINIPRFLILNSEILTLSYAIEVFFYPCVRGEIILSDLSCFKCKPGRFSNLDPMYGYITSINYQRCEICSDKALCPGGQYDFPRPGYWRATEESRNILECFIPEACEGPGNFTKEARLGICAEGHFGNLCNDCISGYGKLNSNFLCEPCNIIRSGALLRLVIAYISLLTYSIICSYMYSIQDGDIENHGYLFVYVKISLNFTQIVTLLTFVKFTWVIPSFKKLFFTSSNAVSLATEDVLLNDCIIQSAVAEIENLYPIKVIIIVFLPLILGFFAALFWIIFYVISCSSNFKNSNKVKKAFYIRLLASFIISIFLFHPLIIRSCFNMLNCFQINVDDADAGIFLFVYPNFQCWSSFHYKIVTVFAVPGILIWGICFPGFLAYLLIKKQMIKRFTKTRTNMKIETKKNFIESPTYSRKSSGEAQKVTPVKINPITGKPESKRKTEFTFDGSTKSKTHENSSVSAQASPVNEALPKANERKGFFYQILKSNVLKFLYYGYKDEYSYWECINFAKKLLVSLLVNLHQIIGFDIIVLLILLILIISIWMQHIFQPFVRDELNFLESLSLISVLLIFLSIVILASGQLATPIYLLYAFASVILLTYLLFSIATATLVFKTIKETKILSKLWKICASFFYFRRREGGNENKPS